jgi:hypothetical protein
MAKPNVSTLRNRPAAFQSSKIAAKKRRQKGPPCGSVPPILGEHLGKRCASSKESPGFSKMRTSREWCASSNSVRIFEDRFWIANLGLRAIETPKPILDCAEIETPDSPNPGLTFRPGRQFGHPKRITVAIRSLRCKGISQSKIQNLKSKIAKEPAKKKPCLNPGTAPRMRDLQLVAVPYFVVS